MTNLILGDSSSDFFDMLSKSGINFDNMFHVYNIIRYNISANRIAVSPKEQVQILDIGCSTGNFLKFMLNNKSLNKEIGYFGIDADDTALLTFRNSIDVELLSNFDLECLDLTVEGSLDNQTGKFDFIYAQLIIEHIPQKSIPSVLRNLKRLLKDDGELIVSMPNPNKEQGKNFVKDPSKSGHFYEYTLEECREIFKSAGFKSFRDFGLFGYYDVSRPEKYDYLGISWSVDKSLYLMNHPSESPYYQIIFKHE